MIFFVTQNVCSGIYIETEHRQNLHELILGAQGVTLNASLQTCVTAIEQHNRALRTRADAIPAAARGAISVEAFCALNADPDIAQKIREAERGLAAARSAETVQREQVFGPLALPTFDMAAIDTLLRRDLPGLEAEAAAKVQAHFAILGPKGENWVADGVNRIAAASAATEHEVCPFCSQDVRLSPVIGHYRAYFSDAYENLKQAITDQVAAVIENHGGDIPVAFERAIRVAIQRREFWKAFTDMPDISVDTAAVIRAWSATRDAILTALRAKQAAPLDLAGLSDEAWNVNAGFEEVRVSIAAISDALQCANESIAIVKERAAVANVAALTADLAKLHAVETRRSAAIAPLCQAYLDEVAAKAATEVLREQARVALDHYRQQVFPAYEAAINDYLVKFNTGFRLARMESVNTRAGSTASYNVLINNVSVSVSGAAGAPSFRNTLSSGDRNTLALAFFFATLDRNRQLAQKTVVIDDPMTSLDEHRSLTTIQEIRRLITKVGQVIVLSHSKPFLCALWDGADTTTRSAIKITRDGAGSTLNVWDVRQDSITEHDKRHATVAAYIQNSNADDDRAVAAALRSILESFMRVAYPEAFSPGTLLGPFINTCQQRLGAASQLLAAQDITELRDLLYYGNRFHHDSNPAWETEVINDQQLLHFARRALAFARRA